MSYNCFIHTMNIAHLHTNDHLTVVCNSGTIQKTILEKAFRWGGLIFPDVNYQKNTYIVF